VLSIDLPRSCGSPEDLSLGIEAIVVEVTAARDMRRENSRTVEVYMLRRPMWNYVVAVFTFPLGLLVLLLQKRETLQATLRVKNTDTGLAVIATGPNRDVHRQVLSRLVEQEHERGNIGRVDHHRLMSEISGQRPVAGPIS